MVVRHIAGPAKSGEKQARKSIVRQKILWCFSVLDALLALIVQAGKGLAAGLDLARTIVRRAERLAVTHPIEGSYVQAYLNRLSDLLWAMARWQEGAEHKLSKERGS